MGKTTRRNTLRKPAAKNYLKIQEENKTLLLKNKELAESLAESNRSYQYMLDQRSKLQRENLELIVQNRELNNRLVKINSLSRNHLEMAIKSSELITSIIYQSCGDNNSSESSHSSDFNHNDNISSRTKAVKPMVGGHVIHRPTINLPRVPTEELVRLGSSARMETVANTPENEPNTGEGTSTNSTNVNPRLTTLNEVEEEETPGTSSPRSNTSNKTVPLLSGIFNDVRVYLSPMDRVFPAHINNRTAIPSTSQQYRPVVEKGRNKRVSGNTLALVGVKQVARIKVDQDAVVEETTTNSPPGSEVRVTRSIRRRTATAV